MKNRLPNIQFTVNNDLCVGCGICSDVCPQKAISIEIKNGLFRPKINNDMCLNGKGCHKCYTICPGLGIDLGRISHKLFADPSTKENEYIGRYINHYVGFSNIFDNRYHCASGGLTSQFLIYLLNRKIISGAIVTKFDNTNPLMVQTFIAETSDEILLAKSSRYSPVTMENVVNKVKSFSGGKVVIVGLPCHIHGFRKLEEKDPRFKEKIFAYFGLYCSCGRSFRLTEYTLQKYHFSRKDIRHFAYRDNGCMGNLNIKYLQNTQLKEFQLPYQEYYLSLRSFFNIHRCSLCIDHFAELADISFGDIHYGKFIEDKVGINSVVSRRLDLDELLHDARNEGFITLEPVDETSLLKSQKYVKIKKHTNTGIIHLYHKFGKKVPSYDVSYQLNPWLSIFKAVFSKKIQIFVGMHKKLWWIVKLCTKKMNNWN